MKAPKLVVVLGAWPRDMKKNTHPCTKVKNYRLGGLCFLASAATYLTLMLVHFWITVIVTVLVLVSAAFGLGRSS